MRHFLTVALLSALVATPAYAQETVPEADPLVSLLPFVFIFAIFYFLLIRPQQKRVKVHQEMVKAVQKGDEVITAGGIAGKISGLEGDDFVLLQIASGVEVKVLKATLSQVQPKPEAGKPAHQEKNEAKKNAEKKSEKNDNSAPKKARIANDN
jgi:preprotein translocase subunit YajC